MILVLDSGGVSTLARQASHLAELRRRGQWPPQVPSVLLAERLNGDHRRDFHANRLLRACQVRPVDEVTSREAARLRTATRRASTVSAVDAVVAALASGQADPVVVTSDPGGLASLVGHTFRPVHVVAA